MVVSFHFECFFFCYVANLWNFWWYKKNRAMHSHTQRNEEGRRKTSMQSTQPSRSNLKTRLLGKLVAFILLIQCTNTYIYLLKDMKDAEKAATSKARTVCSRYVCVCVRGYDFVWMNEWMKRILHRTIKAEFNFHKVLWRAREHTLCQICMYVCVFLSLNIRKHEKRYYTNKHDTIKNGKKMGACADFSVQTAN